MSKTPEGSPSSADVKNNSEKLPVFGKLGQAAVRAAVRAAESAANYLNRAAMAGKEYIDEHTGADASEESETSATSAPNTSQGKQASNANKPEATKSKADNSQEKQASGGTKGTSEKQASNANKPEATKSKADNSQEKQASGGTKGTSEKQASNANKPEATKSKADNSQEKQASGGTKGTSEKQASNANKPEATKSKADNSQEKQASGGTKGTSEKQASNANKPEATKSKADNSQEKQASGGTKGTSEKQASNANKPEATKSKADNSPENNTNDGAKSTSKKQAPDTNEAETKKGKADASQGKQTPDAAADFMRKFLDESKQDQDQVSPEKREAADELEKAKDRHSKASAAAESKNPLGKKRRQAELKAATEQLKKCELLDKAADKLDEDRKIYAETSAAFETYLFKGKKRQAELEAAAKQLKQSELGYMSIKFADKIEAAKQDPEKQAELAAEMAQAAFASMQETSRVTTDKYDSMLDDRSKFKKAVAQVGKWFNKGGKIAQWRKLGGAGFGVGFTAGFFAAPWPITMAAGAVVGLGVAGATKQAVLEEHRGEDRIAADARLETTDPSFKNTVANMKIDDVMEHAVNVSVDNLKDMSIERQDALHKKVKASLGKYSIGFALGGLAGSLAGDWLWDNSAHATGTESQSTTKTPAQSGGEQIPQQSGSTSSMHSGNIDTSNFSSYDHPWSWAADKFGAENAMDQLHNLADKAMANGHTVEWLNNPDGSVYVKVDGSSATKHVLDVLSRYV